MKIKWEDESCLMIRIIGGSFDGIWRHANLGGWCRYIGSSFEKGESATENLQQILNEFVEYGN